MKKILLALLLTGCLDTEDATQDNLPLIIQLPKLSTVRIGEWTVTMSREEYRWLMNHRYTMEQWVNAASERCEPAVYVKISDAPY